MTVKLRSVFDPKEIYQDLLLDKRSLKEVAGLLGLSERTVRRWLPVSVLPRYGITLDSIMNLPLYSVGTARRFLGLTRGKMRKLIRDYRIKLTSCEVNPYWAETTGELCCYRISLKEMLRVLGEEVTFSSRTEIPEILRLTSMVDEDTLIEHTEQ